MVVVGGEGRENGEKELTTSHKLLRNQEIKILKHTHTYVFI